MSSRSSSVYRRALYRRAKKTLYSTLRRRWRGSSASLRGAIRIYLKGRGRHYLFRLVQRPAFALAVAGTLLAGAQVYASSPIDLSTVASGTGGFVINGIDTGDLAGFSVSGAGDVNGDGLADLIVGAPYGDPGGNDEGESYVVFGKADSTAVDLSAVASGTGGFVINGIDTDDSSGLTVSGAGDVNGDGLADLMIGAWVADPGGVDKAGETYIVFGKASGTAIELSAVASGTGGFVINGIDPSDFSGRSISGGGDVNGDGLADLIIGASDADPGGIALAGESYVVFGKASTTAVDLSALGTGGFVINGIEAVDFSGRSISAAGDVNGDGLADLIIGADEADPGVGKEGESYVVFGKASATAVELSAITLGAGGFVINGIDPGDYSGYSVSGAGDVNGDGLADLIVGAKWADPGGTNLAGESYVVFGKATTTAVELSDVAAGIGGYVINGIDANDYSGSSVSGAGDVNGDGLADLIVGAWQARPGGIICAGESYLVFGKANGAAVELSNIASGAGGFVINGIDFGDESGRSVSGAGDVNGDGLADLVVGVRKADPGGNDAGESYVIFSTQTAPTSANYLAYTREGDGAGGDPVVPTILEDARLTIDFSDEDLADNGAGGASIETITLHRSSAGITNFSATPADVYWEIATDRQSWTSALIDFNYLDSDLSSLAGALETQLSVFSASSAAGPWTELTTTIDPAKNKLTVSVSDLANNIFAIGINTDVIWADFAHAGTETGSEPMPFNSLAEALAAVAPGEAVNIKGNTADSDSPETMTINQDVTINAVNGAVTIGNSAARDSRSSDSGFVSGGPAQRE